MPGAAGDLCRISAIQSHKLHIVVIHAFAVSCLPYRMGRMWQTLLLSRWRPLFAWLPVETLIRERQDEYYAALRKADSVGFADPVTEFLLASIHDALEEIAGNLEADAAVPSKQVGMLLSALGRDALSGNELMQRLGLKSRAAFRQNYLLPAIERGLVEMTIPDKPNSRNQKYQKRGRG